MIFILQFYRVLIVPLNKLFTMKKPFFPIVCMLIVSAQFSSAQSYQYLDYNDVIAPVFSSGNLFWDFSLEPIGSYDYHFVVPKPDSVETVPVDDNFLITLWMSGVDDTGGLHTAININHFWGYDYWFGPIADNYTDPSYISRYDHVWKINASDIDAHIANWNLPGYIVPDIIADWPGNGNTDNGEAAILAPFYDFNINGIYDPENGDYPLIRGDQAIFFMFNDAKEAHGESGGLSFGFEIHGMAYQFEGGTDTALDQSVFVNFQIINRSVNQYDDFVIGLFDAFNVGAADDDFMGCDSTRNLMFAYNGDLVDGPSAPNYGYPPPAFGCRFLNQPLSGFINYLMLLDSLLVPDEPAEYADYLHGIWVDGSHMTYGGDGHGGVTNTNLLYTGDPELLTGWNEVTEAHSPGGRMAIGSIGPTSSMPGDTVCIDVVLTYARSYADPIARSSVTKVKLKSDDLQAFYDSTFSSCLITYLRNPDYIESIEQMSEDRGLILSPNPVTNQVVVSCSCPFSTGVYTIFSAEGKIMCSIPASGAEKTIIDLSHLPAGIYLMRYLNESKEAMQTKFIKVE